jgi:hypothetical protein
MTRTGNRTAIKMGLLCLAFGLILGFACVDAALAQKSSPSAAPSLGDGETPLYNGYPKRFDGGGYIDRLSREVIVIDDSNYRLASEVTFNKPTSKNTSSSSFKEGDFVGILVNSNGEVVSVWLIQKRPR